MMVQRKQYNKKEEKIMKHYSSHLSQQIMKDIIFDKLNPKIDRIHDLFKQKQKLYYSKYTNSMINDIITVELIQPSKKANVLPQIHQQLIEKEKQKHNFQNRLNSKQNSYLIRKKSSLPMEMVKNYNRQVKESNQLEFISLIEKQKQISQFDSTERQIQRIRETRGRLNFEVNKNQVKYKQLKKYGKYPITFGFNQQQIPIKEQKLIRKQYLSLKNQIISQEIVKSDVKTIHLQSNLHSRMKSFMFQQKVQFQQTIQPTIQKNSHQQYHPIQKNLDQKIKKLSKMKQSVKRL